MLVRGFSRDSAPQPRPRRLHPDCCRHERLTAGLAVLGFRASLRIAFQACPKRRSRGQPRQVAVSDQVCWRRPAWRLESARLPGACRARPRCEGRDGVQLRPCLLGVQPHRYPGIRTSPASRPPTWPCSSCGDRRSQLRSTRPAPRGATQRVPVWTVASCRTGHECSTRQPRFRTRPGHLPAPVPPDIHIDRASTIAGSSVRCITNQGPADLRAVPCTADRTVS